MKENAKAGITTMVPHLEPDILECEVKWALGSFKMNKANGGDRIAAELFKIIKKDALKCCSQYAIKFGKVSHSHKTGTLILNSICFKRALGLVLD